MVNYNTTWRKELEGLFKSNEETFADIEQCTLTEEQLDKEFDSGYGGTCGEPFTIWTKNYVYFPIQYDGSEWAGCVARNPDGKPTSHFGGG